MKIFLAAFLIIILNRTMIQIVVNCLLMKNVVKTQVNKNKNVTLFSIDFAPIVYGNFPFLHKTRKDGIYLERKRMSNWKINMWQEKHNFFVNPETSFLSKHAKKKSIKRIFILTLCENILVM